MPTVLNHTPHPITLHVGSSAVTIVPSGTILRVPHIASSPVDHLRIGDVEVPIVTVCAAAAAEEVDLDPETWHIVSRAYAEAHHDHPRLLVPHDLVRDESGRVIAARSLARAR